MIGGIGTRRLVEERFLWRGERVMVVVVGVWGVGLLVVVPRGRR
jgi:hypothetical protein